MTQYSKDLAAGGLVHVAQSGGQVGHRGRADVGAAGVTEVEQRDAAFGDTVIAPRAAVGLGHRARGRAQRLVRDLDIALDAAEPGQRTVRPATSGQGGEGDHHQGGDLRKPS